MPFTTPIHPQTGMPMSGRGVLNTDYIVCAAEDANGNGKLDAGEDTNGNGKLDPQNPAVISADDTTPTLESGYITTDENGFGYFALVYPQSNATWTTAIHYGKRNSSECRGNSKLYLVFAHAGG